MSFCNINYVQLLIYIYIYKQTFTILIGAQIYIYIYIYIKLFCQNKWSTNIKESSLTI